MIYYIYLYLLLIILSFTKSDNLKDKAVDKNLTVDISQGFPNYVPRNDFVPRTDFFCSAENYKN